ncbi:MAG: cupin domain-containing protein [Phycisphaeraceae bacterium]|nr:cupin domain-containing protein [Phycisphaeraceae bacterium]
MTTSALPAGPVELAKLIAYQPASVVSQTLLKKPAGTVTLFAFDAGEGLSEHTAPFDALIYACEGAATFRIGDQDHAISAGQILRLPAGSPHALRTTTPFKMLLVMIREPA